ncbi:MAG: protein kinase [Kiritimatiellae bacterium]|nr:protein kinase [Kiritimatiellia bacterium]
MSANAAKIIGGFRVLQELQAGSGSQGTVYKAVCAEDKHGLVPVGTVVALKVMPVQDGEGAQWRKLQKRTAELARLDHPNVVKYYGCFSEQGMFNDVHVVVQEFLQGVTLKERLARQKTGLDVDDGLRVVDATLAGLDYMAQRGIVHRDLKPGNIFLCDDGGVKLIDFEIAKQEGGTVTASVGNIRGSFDYMAPDFTNPEFHGDVQSDVFSMGVVLHEVLSGKTPYERLEGDDKQANFAFLSRWSQTLSSGRNPIHVSSRVKRLLAHADDVLMHALAPDREERYRDFSSFRGGLKSIRFRSLKSGDASYQLLQFIGKGGFGEVFKARDRRTGQLVAIKHLMKTAYAERFYREAKIMRRLTSPCFVRFVDFFVLEVGGGQEAFLVMAFLDGMPGNSLRDAIKRRAETPMQWRDVFVAFARYARGLLAIHQQGIYHRDIKPSNLYYPQGRPGEAAIMDLGIARDVNGTATTGQVPGTLDYMPPEVVISDSRGDGGMDIYALGLCLYEALTGKMAFPRLPTGTTSYAAFFERAKAKKNPSFDATEVQDDGEVLSLLKDMTNPDVSRRLNDAGMLLKRLESIIDSRFGGDADEDSATVAPTIAMPNGDSATVATSVIEGPDAAAIERERQRLAKSGKARHRFILLIVVTLMVALAGATAYYFRSPIMEKIESINSMKDAKTEKPETAPPPVESHDEDEKVRREKEEADQEETQRKIKEQQDALKAQQEAVERQRKELEERQKKLDAERREEESRKKAEEKAAAEEAARIAEDKAKSEVEKARRLAEEQARRDAEAKAQREAAEKAAEEAVAKAAEEARKKAEAEMAAKMAEMARQLKEAQEKAEKEKAEREAEAKRLELERKAAEDARKEAERKAEEERRRLAEERKAAEERAAREKAEREAEERRLEEERQKVLAAQKKAKEEAERIAAEREAAEKAKREAEEKARKLEEEQRKAEEARKKRESTARDLASNAGLYYESENYYDAVKYYWEAVRNGYTLTADEEQRFADAYKQAASQIRIIRSRSENMIRLKQTPIRKIEDLDAESKNLIDWYNDVKKKAGF